MKTAKKASNLTMVRVENRLPFTLAERDAQGRQLVGRPDGRVPRPRDRPGPLGRRAGPGRDGDGRPGRLQRPLIDRPLASRPNVRDETRPDSGRVFCVGPNGPKAFVRAGL